MKYIQQLKTCYLYGDALNWLNGEMLGDGCVLTRSPHTAYFLYGSKYLDYINYVSDTLWSFGIFRAGTIHKQINKNYGSCVYKYESLAYCELKSIRDLWYPSGIKDVPRSTELTPLTCRQWYIGDGCLFYSTPSSRLPSIQLYTCAFSESTVVWLVKRLNDIGIQATRQPSRNSIGISIYSVKDFLSYIGRCPVECYKYKWLEGSDAVDNTTQARRQLDKALP